MRDPLIIGLVNNMPDAALRQTERQFAELLQAAAPQADVVLRLFSIPKIQRSEVTRAQMRDRYQDIGHLASAKLDALIVTGAEPIAKRLDEEPFWPGFVETADWAMAARIPTLWSCLAAHALVLRLDGVERQPLPAKLSGVFPLDVDIGHPLMQAAGVRGPVQAPHSRQNDLAESDLVKAGYEILSRSPVVGVDSFVRPGAALTLCLQGHPEYEAASLPSEYLRDVGRFLRNARPDHPSPPQNHFDSPILGQLKLLEREANVNRDPALIIKYAEALQGKAQRARWRPWALQLCRLWLSTSGASTSRRVALSLK